MVLPHDPAPPFSLAEVFPGKCHPSGHRPVAPGQVPGCAGPRRCLSLGGSETLCEALPAPRHGLHSPRTALKTQCSTASRLKKQPGNQALPNRQNRAAGTSALLGNEPFRMAWGRRWSCLTSASPGCCARVPGSGKCPGVHSSGAGTAMDQHLPVPLRCSLASPGACCANRGAHPTAPHQSAPPRPSRGDWCSGGSQFRVLGACGLFATD